MYGRFLRRIKHDLLNMRIGIYKDTLANKRGADVAVLALAEGLRERFGGRSCELGVVCGEVVVFEKNDFEKRIKEPWDLVISTGTNELLDLYNHFKDNSTRSTRSARSLFPLPVIQQFHTNPKSQFKWKRIVRNWKIRRALRCVSAIQVLSEKFVPHVEKYGVPVHVIGNWSKFSSELRVTHNSQLPIIIYPAAFAKGKNQKLLIEAFAKVAAKFPEWRLRLLGRIDGRYAEDCQRLVAAMGGTGFVHPRIEFPGFCEDMAAEYAQCAFVAFPSVDEGFGLVVADAAAFAKPCVMVKDWIGTAKSGGGIMTRPTVAAYAEGLRRLMADAELRRTLGRAAQSFCAEHYSRETILDKWELLLADTVPDYHV